MRSGLSLDINAHRRLPRIAFPCDGLAVSGAWGVRKLRSGHGGAFLRLRRSSDNAEAEFGANASGWLDTSALLAWAGTDSAYVVTFYDQSGNGLNVTQATAASQPRIVNAGLLETAPNGRPWLRFADGQLLTTTYASGLLPHGADPSTLMVVARMNVATSGNNHIVLYGDLAGTNPRRTLYYSQAVDSPRVSNGVVSRFQPSSWNGAMRSVFGLFEPPAASGLSLSVDGVTTPPSPIDIGTGTPATGTLRLGHNSNAAGSSYGLAEAAIFPGMATADQIARLRADHQSVWGTP